MVIAQDTGTSRRSCLRPGARKPKPVISLVVLRDLLNWDERVDLDIRDVLLGLEGLMLRCEENNILSHCWSGFLPKMTCALKMPLSL